jgi:hypothetical protein
VKSTAKTIPNQTSDRILLSSSAICDGDPEPTPACIVIIDSSTLWGMRFNVNLSIAAILCFLPVVFVVMVIFRKRKEQRAFSRAPFKELQRRPAGETIRLKLEALDEKSTMKLWGCFCFRC